MKVKPASRDLLLVVDVQNDFCSEGALGVPHGEDVVPEINFLIRQFLHVGLTQDWHPRGHVSFASSHPGMKPMQTINLPYGAQILWPDHCIPGTRGAELHPGLEVMGAEFIIRKGFDPWVDSYSAFFENDRRTSTGLAGYLRNRDILRLFLAGLATDFCVQYSALDARAEGFEVFVVEEAVRGIDMDFSVAKAWQSMAGAGVHRIQASDLSM